MGPSERGLCEIQQIVHRVAARLQRQTPLRTWDVEDVEQELLVRLISNWPRYDPARGTEVGFAIVVTRSNAVSLIREVSAQKRSLLITPTFSNLGADLNPPAPDGEYDRVDARLDAAALMDLLDDPELRTACLMLSREGATRAAHHMGTSRSAVYRLLDRIRARAREGTKSC